MKRLKFFGLLIMVTTLTFIQYFSTQIKTKSYYDGQVLISGSNWLNGQGVDVKSNGGKLLYILAMCGDCSKQTLS